RTLREHKDKIPADLNKEVEDKIAAVRSALQGKDVESLKRATQDLNETLQKVGQAVYRQQPPPGGPQQPPPGSQPPPPGGGGKEGGEGTVEGEFREV
ncbi:MAG: molecular chaperone DnaK, partial [Chloroflexota bacterium]